MGVGTLIIFISLLLVAAVAAGVLIQTAGSLQQKALSTGSQATGQISTNAVALEVSATDGTNDNGVGNYSMIMKLAPGSDSIKLEDATLRYSTTTNTITYQYRSRYNDTVYCQEGGQNLTNPQNCTEVGSETGNFTAEYLQTGTNHQDGVLVRGDVLKVYFESANAVDEGSDVRIRFIPKIGTATDVRFSTPDVMSTERVYLYP